MIELTMNTKTAESTIGSHKAPRETIRNLQRNRDLFCPRIYAKRIVVVKVEVCDQGLCLRSAGILAREVGRDRYRVSHSWHAGAPNLFLGLKPRDQLKYFYVPQHQNPLQLRAASD